MIRFIFVLKHVSIDIASCISSFKSETFYGMSPKIKIRYSEYFELIKQKDAVWCETLYVADT
jgi:hypothetical protein